MYATLQKRTHGKNGMFAPPTFLYSYFVDTTLESSRGMTRRMKHPSAHARFGFAFLVLAIALSTSACSGGKTAKGYLVYTGGSAQRGQQVIEHFRCGACHTIPGVPNAEGTVGPPLNFYARRTFIAGELPNTPGNLERWVLNPRAVEPGTAMPNLGLSQEQARDVAAYLYTLR